MKKHNQKGFTIVEILLALLVAAAIGFGGYWVWHSQDQKSNSTTITSTTSNSSTETTTSATSKQFVFKELGVEMTLPDSLNGLGYTTENSYLYLYDDAFVNALKNCSDYKAGDYGGGFVAIGKADGQFPSSASYVDVGALLKQFPNFYISLGVPNGNFCSDLSQSENNKAVADTERAAFIKAFQTTAKVSQ